MCLSFQTSCFNRKGTNYICCRLVLCKWEFIRVSGRLQEGYIMRLGVSILALMCIFIFGITHCISIFHASAQAGAFLNKGR